MLYSISMWNYRQLIFSKLHEQILKKKHKRQEHTAIYVLLSELALIDLKEVLLSFILIY